MQAEASEVIAERSYTTAASSEVVLRIEIRRPRKVELGACWCDWKIVGEQIDVAASACGVDTLDALDAALWMVGSRLEILNQDLFEGQLRFLSGPTRSPLSLPVIRIDGDFRANYA
jgi:hypothetical protein